MYVVAFLYSVGCSTGCRSKRPRSPRLFVLDIKWIFLDFGLNSVFLCFLTKNKTVAKRDHHDRNGKLPSVRRTGVPPCQLRTCCSELGLCGSRLVHRNTGKLLYVPDSQTQKNGLNGVRRGCLAHKPQQQRSSTAAKSSTALSMMWRERDATLNARRRRADMVESLGVWHVVAV